MHERLAGKIAIMTAAGQGIGLATAKRFVSEGADVWAVDIDGAKLETLAQELPCIHPKVVDVTNADEVNQLVASIGRAPDILFNCVGYVHHGSLLDCDEEAWDFSFETNVKSMYLTIRAVLPSMIEAGGGNIINMGSAVSSLRGKAMRCAYGATKGAVIGLTRSIATDYAKYGIRCNAVCPTVVDTPSLRGRIDMTDDPEETYRAFVAQQPLGRLGTPEDVAALVAFLASDDAGFITGTSNIIDGGKLA
jgi:2-keto-3-deoxy-L-fuconate dehydrogenase